MSFNAVRSIYCFQSASVLLATQTAVTATADLSVFLSVCLSVTFQCFVQTNKDTIVWSSASVGHHSSFGRSKVYLDIRRGSPL